MISFEKNFLFIHIPKTAGTSLKQILSPYEERELFKFYSSDMIDELSENNLNWKEITQKYYRQAMSGDRQKFERINLLQNSLANVNAKIKHPALSGTFHLTFTQYLEIVDKERFDNFIKFSIVRNPYDRAISLHMWKNKSKFNREVFINDIKHLARKRFNDWNPMCFRLCELIDAEEKKKEHKEYFSYGKTVDFVLRYESDLNNDKLKSLCDYLNIAYEPIKQLNKSKDKKHYSSYYDEEMKKVVYEYYKIDFETFGYSFNEKL